ncbi:MAG: hypothetical protein QG635_2410, partial [Bacteroidota bacterium]|nr:hypothetical protein [Bacteroidota bacterium]
MNFRAIPRVDLSCVESQATELIPDIVEAGINVIRNFIPEFSITVSADAGTGKVTGSITHHIDQEYNQLIYYNGSVNIKINGKISNTALKATKGAFSGTVNGMKKGDKIAAFIDFADITVSSDEATATQSGGGTSTKQNFSFSWEYRGDIWPREACDFGISGYIETYDGAEILEISRDDWGGVYIYVNKYDTKFKISYSSSASMLVTSFDTTYKDGSRDVYTILGDYEFSNNASGFTDNLSTKDSKVELLSALSGGSGSITSFLYYTRRLVQYDDKKVITYDKTGSGMLPLIKVNIRKY